MTNKDKIRKVKNSLYLVVSAGVADDVCEDIGELLKISYEEGARDQRNEDFQFISGYFSIDSAMDALEEEPLIKAE